jgi:hypothetical protein
MMGPAGAPPPREAPSSNTAQTVGWVLVGTGAVAAIGGGIFWILRSNEVSNLQGECHVSGNGCPSSAQSDISNGKAYDTISVALFAVGGAALVTGAGLLVFGGHHGSASAQLVPVAGPRVGGLQLVGSF